MLLRGAGSAVQGTLGMPEPWGGEAGYPGALVIDAGLAALSMAFFEGLRFLRASSADNHCPGRSFYRVKYAARPS